MYGPGSQIINGCLHKASCIKTSFSCQCYCPHWWLWFLSLLLFFKQAHSALSKACAAWVTTVTPSKTSAVSKGFGALVMSDHLIWDLMLWKDISLEAYVLFFKGRYSWIHRWGYVLFHRRLMVQEAVFLVDFLERIFPIITIHENSHKTSEQMVFLFWAHLSNGAWVRGSSIIAEAIWFTRAMF